jgi:hypothetical protein
LLTRSTHMFLQTIYFIHIYTVEKLLSLLRLPPQFLAHFSFIETWRILSQYEKSVIYHFVGVKCVFLCENIERTKMVAKE